MLKTHLLLTVCALALFSIFLTRGALAQNPSSTFPKPQEVTKTSELKPHVGVKLGPNDSTGSYNTALGYGAELGFQPYLPFGVGAELYRFHSESNQDSVPDLDRTQLLIKGTYNFGGTIPVIRNSYAGAQLGPVLDIVNSVSYVRAGLGLLAGADFFVLNSNTEQKAISVGVAANYLWVNNADADTLGVNGIVKYWF